MEHLKRLYLRPETELLDIRLESLCFSGDGNEDVSKQGSLNDDDFE